MTCCLSDALPKMAEAVLILVSRSKAEPFGRCSKFSRSKVSIRVDPISDAGISSCFIEPALDSSDFKVPAKAVEPAESSTVEGGLEGDSPDFLLAGVGVEGNLLSSLEAVDG